MQNINVYRPHIDGLRAVAVLSIAIFHLRVVDLRGGFIGVDIFFVISGFLISKIIIPEVLQNSFSFSAFYLRRARRILPAFFMVSAATMAAGYYILLPKEYADLAASFAASTVFGANIYFAETANYFGPSAMQMPMLHYWSLGVEEQFYILFPILLLVIARFSPRLLVPALALLALASFIAAQVAILRSPSAAFYLLPFRAGELLIGALIAASTATIRCRWPNAVALTGLALERPMVEGEISISRAAGLTGLSRNGVCDLVRRG